MTTLTPARLALLKKLRDAGGWLSRRQMSRGNKMVERPLLFAGLIAYAQLSDRVSITNAGRIALAEQEARDVKA